MKFLQLEKPENLSILVEIPGHSVQCITNNESYRNLCTIVNNNNLMRDSLGEKRFFRVAVFTHADLSMLVLNQKDLNAHNYVSVEYPEETNNMEG